jgi:hypothetical protein
MLCLTDDVVGSKNRMLSFARNTRDHCDTQYNEGRYH